MIEAIDNGVKLVVIVTERIPRGDVAQMVEFADEHGARIIGPNCLGIIVPDVVKMGGIGGPAKDAAKSYSPGPVGVISRSGGMTTEMSSTLSAAGLGQSTAVSIGGDAIIGQAYAELMPLFEADEQTQAIVIYTEPGGRWRPSCPNGSRTTTRGCRSSPSWPGASWTRCRDVASATPARSSRARRTPRPRRSRASPAAGIVVAERIEDIPGS